MLNYSTGCREKSKDEQLPLEEMGRALAITPFLLSLQLSNYGPGQNFFHAISQLAMEVLTSKGPEDLTTFSTHSTF